MGNRSVSNAEYLEALRKYKPMIYRIISKYPASLEDELFQNSTICLYRALLSFNDKGSTKFSTYLYSALRIEAYICFMQNSAPLRIPSNKYAEISRYIPVDESVLDLCQDEHSISNLELAEDLSSFWERLKFCFKYIPIRDINLLLQRVVGGVSYADLEEEYRLKPGSSRHIVVRTAHRLCHFYKQKFGLEDAEVLLNSC